MTSASDSEILFAIRSDALLVANRGRPFSRRGVISICASHLSEKQVGPEDHFDASDEALVERMLAEARAFGLEPPSEREWSESLGTEREHLQDLLAHLKREGRMVRAPGDLWFSADAIAELRDRIVAHFESRQRLDTKAYKALIGTSRRTAVPLMEYFDDEHLTTRSGDARVLRQAQREAMLQTGR